MGVHAEVLTAIEHELRVRHDLSVSEFEGLAHLPPRGGLRHQQLAERVILTRSALTRMVDRLEARGLVRREVSVDDRRGVSVCLTDEGRRLRRAAVRTNNRVVRRVFGPQLEEEDIETLVRSLGRTRPRADEPEHQG